MIPRQEQIDMAEQEKAAPKPPDETTRLRAENDRLKGELAAAKEEAAVAKADQRLSYGRAERPFLSEGERQDLEQYGVTNSPFTGERITAEDEGVETQIDPASVPPARTGNRGAVEGFDYVYPSVAPGVLDPALTGRN